MSNYAALILDDDLENIKILNLYLNKYCKNITPIYTASTLNEAIDTNIEHKPNLLFLDIQLGNETSSFQLLDNFDTSDQAIIFVTSHDKFALKAIEHHAKGYILKPIKVENLIATVNKVTATLDNAIVQKQKIVHLDTDFIAIASTDKIDLIKYSAIISCSSDGKYTVFSTTDKTYISSKNLGEYENLLDSKIFIRIHRQHIVNINHVIQFDKTTGLSCKLSNGKNLPISKRKKEELKTYLRL